IAVRTIEMEAASIQKLADYIDSSFEDVVDCMLHCKGRIVITGVGKSAIIAQKIVATLNSTGSPSLFLHDADAIHGYRGMIQQDDAVIIISKSGESAEIKVFIPLVRNFGNKIIA